jgi:succinate-semialdehyde dehydrogenase/glutarate-semialdehyde dehydrogenase
VQPGADTLAQYAELGPLHRGHSLQGGWSATDLMVPEPRGVVAVLTPWDDPVAVAAGLLVVALVTGNTVVHKPSERCPRTGRRFAELLATHLPDGVLEILDGDSAVGARLTAAEQVDVVAHVGSTATGRAIARACAERGAKALLEKGGNDALIVDAGVEPRWAAEQVALGAFANAGQICVSVERVYVVEAAADAFVDALVAEARSWADRIGPLVGAQEAWRLPVGTVKINAVFGGAPGGAAEPRRASGSGFGFGLELLDEMTAMKVVHWSPPGR